MNSATWPLRQAARASHLKPRTLGQWFETGVMRLTGCDKPSSGSGVPVGLSRQRVLQAAVTKALKDIGLSSAQAARAALAFTDEGQTGRLAGELFHHGRTLLAIEPDGAHVRNCFHDTPLSDFTKAKSTIVVDLNQIVEQVDSVLKEELH